MIKVKNIALLLLLTGVMIACNCKKNGGKKNSKNDTSLTGKVTVKAGYDSATHNDAFQISNAVVEGDKLTLYVTYGGGCKTHDFNAFAGENYLKSMPPKIGVFIEHNANEDLCKAIVSDTLTFDISTIKYPGKDKDYTVVFSVNNWKGDLIYKY